MLIGWRFEVDGHAVCQLQDSRVRFLSRVPGLGLVV